MCLYLQKGLTWKIQGLQRLTLEKNGIFQRLLVQDVVALKGTLQIQIALRVRARTQKHSEEKNAQ